MSAQKYGGKNIDDGELQAGWSIRMGEFGATEATATYLYRREENSESSIQDKVHDKIDTAHEFEDWLKCTKATASFKDGFVSITCNYKGFKSTLQATKYRIEASLAEEPIDTHPKFAEFAGKPSEMNEALGYVPDTGAKFTSTDDLTAKFKKFCSNGEDNNGRQSDSLSGVTQYLRPEIILVEDRTLGEGLGSGDTAQLVEDLGKYYKNTPDDILNASGQTTTMPDIMPDDYDEGDWLLISADYSPQGDGGILTRKWRLSGIYGWNEMIYEKGSDSIGAGSRGADAYGQGGDAFEETNKDNFTEQGSANDIIELVDEFPNEATYETTEEKFTTAKYKYTVLTGKGLDLAKEFLTNTKTHEDDSLSATSAVVTGLEGGLEMVEINFAGVPEDGDWKPSVSVSTSSEPIDTHPNFHKSDDDAIGGTFEKPENGAIFDGAEFKEFANYVSEDMDTQSWWKTKLDSDQIIDGHMPNAMGGIKSYLEAGVEWTETKYFSSIRESVKELKHIGYIGDPKADEPSAPNIKSNVRGNGFRNWLLVGVTWEMVSTDSNSGFKVQATYRLSGNRGWNDIIYESR